MMRRLLMGALASALVFGVAGAGAGHEAAQVKSYTGCLTVSAGLITQVKEGDSPQWPCAAPFGQTKIHLSGGDITSVTPGPGLTGGGAGGAVTIGLSAQQSLPACASGQVPKWSGTGWACGTDNDTTYSAGADLDLAGTTFSVKPGSFARANRSCAAGQFATGVNASGDPTCAAPGAIQVLRAQRSGGNLPDGGVETTFLSLPVPAGTYVFIGKGVINDDFWGFRDGFGIVHCDLKQGAAALDGVTVTMQNDQEGLGDSPFALTAFAATSGETFRIACRITGNDVDGVSVQELALLALKLA